jgi:phage gp36-like protein
MAYASATDLIARFDEGVVADLCGDNGVPAADLSSNTKLSTALSDASGDINSAVMVSDLYTADDLADLTGDDLAFLKRLTCDLAMGYLMGRRPEKYAEGAVKNLTEQARTHLEQIRQGVHLFNIEATKSAGQPDIDGPTALDYQRMNLLPDRTRNFYPSRSSRLPLGRG